MFFFKQFSCFDLDCRPCLQSVTAILVSVCHTLIATLSRYLAGTAVWVADVQDSTDSQTGRYRYVYTSEPLDLLVAEDDEIV